MDCIDDDLAKKIVDFLTIEFADGASGGLTDLIDMIQNFQDFGAQIPPEVQTCVHDDQDMKALGEAYSLDETITVDEI